MTDNKLISCFGYSFVAIAIIVYSTIISGLVLAVLWGWFITPVFGLPVLTIMQAVGVGYVVSYTTQRVDTSTKPEENPIGKALVTAFTATTGRAAVFLVFGYIIKSLI